MQKKKKNCKINKHFYVDNLFNYHKYRYFYNYELFILNMFLLIDFLIQNINIFEFRLKYCSNTFNDKRE